MNTFVPVLCAFFLFSLTVFSQVPTSTPVPNPEDDVVKITTNLVQVDALVTDKDGNQVTDLKAEDFEIAQDGKPQKITNFTYVGRNVASNQNAGPATKSDKSAPVPPVLNNKNNDFGRIFTFIVDDGNCSLSQFGVLSMQDSLEKFVTRMMQPNDLVAIYQTRGGSSLLQQYTSDKTQLLRVIKKIRWYPASGACFLGNDYFEKDPNREVSGDLRASQVVGSIGVMRYIVRGLERVPGRKVVFLMSEGLSIAGRSGTYTQALDALRELTDLANRASVTFNTFDVRGVQSAIMIGAADDVAPVNPNSSRSNGTSRLINDRNADLINSQNGLFYLAEETGGRFFKDSNSIDHLLQKSLDLEKGYYLIGYEPEDETFRGKKYHKLRISLKRPDLKVYSRAGFIGQVDEEVKLKGRTADSELYAALIAPLPKNGLDLRLTAFFGSTREEGDFVRALVYLNGEDITFADDANYKKAVFDVVAVTLDEKGKVVDEFNRTHTFKVEPAAVDFIKRNGLIYSTDITVKKAGTYNFRVAVRDASSRALGSAVQILQVPDLKKNKLFLSGLSVSQADANGKFSTPSAVRPENALAMTASFAVPSIRKFKPGMILAYSYSIYNARLDKASNQPNIEVQMNLYRDGKLLVEGKSEPARLQPQTDWLKINEFGYFKLNQNVEPNDYALQIIVKDLASKETVSQWIDFEVTN